MIKALLVEDSLVIQEFLKYLLESDPDIRIVGAAKNGAEAVDKVVKMSPDVVIMDINMPEVDGFEATRLIMGSAPRPIILVTANHDPKSEATSFRALEAGALTVLDKPMGLGNPGYEESAGDLIQTVKSMSAVKVEPQRLRTRRAGTRASSPSPAAPCSKVSRAEAEIVAIGTSAGGPGVLRAILSGVSKDFPMPLLIVQHITRGFVQGLAEWLEQSSGFPVQLAAHNQPLLPGQAYLAPDNFHMGVTPGRRIALSSDVHTNLPCPSISYLFRSVFDVFGPKVVGVLLTGMGDDGVDGLRLMRKRGALTIAQDEESSLANGIPRLAAEAGAAQYIMPPAQIVQTLIEIGNRRGTFLEA